jgi:hypothetical protein
MTTRTSTLRSLSASGAHRAADPRDWNRAKITLVSTCPNCGCQRPQHGYTRSVLFNLVNTRRTIDAYCNDCNVCWPISESERRTISPQ